MEGAHAAPIYRAGGGQRRGIERAEIAAMIEKSGKIVCVNEGKRPKIEEG